MPELPHLITAGELALSLGQDKKTIYRWREEKGLPAYCLGRRLLFDPADVLAWLDSRRVGSINSNGAAANGPAEKETSSDNRDGT